jgi:RNA polymerase sigma factor, sigma-70 family
MSVSSAEFDKTYKEYHAEIYRFIFTIARRDVDSTDCISQNTWQNAYTYYGSLRDKNSRRSWLYSIARNEAKRYFSNRTNAFFQSAIALEDGDDAIDVISEKDSEFPEELANGDLLAKLLNKLPADEQRLILLHYAYDLDLKEIAEIGGLNYNTLKSTFRRTMEKLRKAAEEMGADVR